MWGLFRGASVIAALLLPTLCYPQDITLTSREGNLQVSGTLIGFDGEFYRIDTPYGQLTVDHSGVMCDGPACPDLTAPNIQLRFLGLPGLGQSLAESLTAAFAQHRGLIYEKDDTAKDFRARLLDGSNQSALATVTFQGADPSAARMALIDGSAEFVISAAQEPGFANRVAGLDAMVAVVSSDNPLTRISTRDLARILTGEVQNWQDVGGPDMPLVLYGLKPDDGIQIGLVERLGREIKPDEIAPDPGTLASIVAKDPWSIAMTLRSARQAARELLLIDSCGFPLPASSLAVKTEDYPLSLPFYITTPKRRLPLLAREFLEFLSTPSAQMAVAQAGLINRQPERQSIAADGLRLINAIQGAGQDTTLQDLQNLVAAMNGADRLSFTFRFEDGSSTLDGHSRTNLIDLAQLIEAGILRGPDMLLAGFSDGSGDGKSNQALSLSRATEVVSALRAAAPGLSPDDLPQVAGFGEALPIACDETPAGRRLNRRVEVWLRSGPTDNPRPEN